MQPFRPALAFVVALFAAIAVAADGPVKTFPITVRGRAVDLAGEPIAGAAVYIASQRADWKRLAEATTDAEGRYEFRNVPLPVDRPEWNNARDIGVFEVFGRAEGYGFAWRPRKEFYPGGKPAGGLGTEGDGQGWFDPSDEIMLGLTFPPSATFRGRVVDEKGKPIPGADLAIRYCDPEWDQADYGDIRSGRSFESLNSRAIVPPEMKVRKTDAEGRFEFTGLPENCRFRIDVRPPGFPSRWIWAVTRVGVHGDARGNPVYSGDVELAFVTPREVPIRVLYADSGLPAEKVLVSGMQEEGSAGGTTDADGKVKLRLPPGDCRYELLPRIGTPYLVTEGGLQVAETPPEAPIELKLKAAAVVEVAVVDEATGRGLAGVDLWSETPTSSGTPHRDIHYFRSFEVETRIAHVERPRTDGEGVLRALFEPGWHPIGIGMRAFPTDYEPTEPEGRLVEARTGETTRVTFRMRQRR